MTVELPKAKSVAVNPSQAEMREWALEHLDDATLTEFDNINYKARIKARQAPSTFFISDEPTGKPTKPREFYDEWAAKQDAHIAEQDMILIEGYIGPDPDFRTASRLFMEKTQANIPAMQQQLYFPKDDQYGEAEFTVIYTPTLRTPEFGEDCLILVDLDNYVTRVFGSDYFGESKMGGLRMWNRLVYDRGGLAMHSGAKTFPGDQTASGEEELALIIGLSGTGKTTTTFRNVLGSLPVQDDFIALMPDGTVHATEDGCFAKTFGLTEEDEPQIYGGATSPKAWLESTHVDEDGTVDFFNDSYHQNGRCTFSLDMIEHRDPRDLPKANYLFILNRNEDIVPAIAKLKPEQAAYYFMLGETKGTSAGGAAEAGKKLRVPGTNPFWFENAARAARAARARGLPAQHRPCRWRGRRRRQQEGPHPGLGSRPEGRRARQRPVGRGPRLRLLRAGGARGRRPREAAAPKAVRGAGPHRRVRGHGQAAQGRPRRVPRQVRGQARRTRPQGRRGLSHAG